LCMLDPEGRLKTFSYSGRVSPRLAWVAPVYLLLAGAFGFVYQWLLDGNPLILLSPLLTIAFGLLLGGVGIACLKLGGVRNRRVALLLLWALFGAFYGVALLSALGAFGPDFEGLGASLRHKFSQGDPIPGGKDMLSPGVLGIAYGAELFLLLLGGLGLPWTWWKSAVFDEERAVFLPRERLGSRFGLSPDSFRALILDKGIGAILDSSLRSFAENGEEGEFLFYAHRSEDAAYLSILWRGAIRGPSGRKIVREWVLFRRLEVDSRTLKEFERRSLAPGG